MTRPLTSDLPSEFFNRCTNLTQSATIDLMFRNSIKLKLLTKHTSDIQGLPVPFQGKVRVLLSNYGLWHYNYYLIKKFQKQE